MIDQRPNPDKNKGQQDDRKTTDDTGRQQRAAREAAALRANLAKRKAQKRARKSVTDADTKDRIDP